MIATVLQNTISAARHKPVTESCAATSARPRAGQEQSCCKLQIRATRRLKAHLRCCSWRQSHRQPLLRPLRRFNKHRAVVPAAQAVQADSEYPKDSSQNNHNKAGVLSALQGVKAENSFVIAIFLKILLLSSSGSIVAAKLIQSGYGHSVGALQGLSIVPAAIGVFLVTRYILQHRLHLRRGFAWGIFIAGVTLLFLSNRYSAMQRKYAVAPAPPVAHVAPRDTSQQHSRPQALPTAEDSDKIFETMDESQGDTVVDRKWRNKRD